MRKVFRRLVAAFFVILMLVTLFPFQVFAVDPVSAATMANALAQALTAYGASHGVSMMFDVSTTTGIGEGLHDLWGQFKTAINDNNVPTYDSLAVTLWTNLYSKVRDSVAINVSAENVGYFDQFWNWLLSGPAEMQKVDDSYAWTVDPGTGTVVPIHINSIGELVINGKSLLQTTDIIVDTFDSNRVKLTQTHYVFSQPVYAYQAIRQPSNIYLQPVIMFNNTFTVSVCVNNYANNTTGQSTLLYSDIPKNSYGSYYYWALTSEEVKATGSFTDQNNIYSPMIYDLPYYYNLSNRTSEPEAIFGAASTAQMSTDNSSISVQPYVGDTVPQNVPIPDTDDPDYSPLPYVGPLGVPWIDNNFGDGETMTDAQREAIAGALDGAIEDDGTLTLEEDQTVPDNPSGEVIGGPSAYTVPGLADVFPFCIPFDIYHFLQALSAEPTPPHFTATLDFPEAVGGSQEIDIDFDTPTFNQIAAILRTMELLAFCVGLALLTRSMFLRG